MIDTNAELDFEKRAALLTNSGYFNRVRELARTMSIKAAWEQVERELPCGLRRYTSYISFEAAKTKEANGTLPKPQFKGE
jgi:hypothetical protein